MRRIILTSLLLTTILFSPVKSRQIAAEELPTPTVAERAYAATAILYKQTASGGMDMACTATAFEKRLEGYLFVSASHCVAEDNKMHQKAVVESSPFYVSFDQLQDKTFHKAEVVMAGYQSRGDDFAILSVDTEAEWPTMPLGDASLVKMGEQVLNVAAPVGLGRQLFFGRVSLLDMDRPVTSREINWSNAMLLQVDGGPGSSGSSVISLEQEAIVCFIVGSVRGNPSVVSIPVSRFMAFRDAVRQEEYTWFP